MLWKARIANKSVLEEIELDIWLGHDCQISADFLSTYDEDNMLRRV